MSTQAAHATPPRPMPVPGHLRSLVFRGLRSLLDVRIELASRLTVLVGANGSGKSSVLDGAHYLSQLLWVRGGENLNLHALADQLFTGERALERLATRGVPAADLLLAMLTRNGGVWLNASATEDGTHYRLSVAGAEALTGTPPWPAEAVVEFGSSMSLKDLQRSPQALGLGSCVRLRLDARRVKKPSYSEDEEPRVGYDGSNLATTLAWLGNNARDARDAIESDLARVVPGVRAIKVPRIKITRTEEEYLRIDDEIVPRHRKRELVADTVEVEFAEAGFLPISQLSEGTVLALALLTVLHSPACPNLVDIKSWVEKSRRTRIRFAKGDPSVGDEEAHMFLRALIWAELEGFDVAILARDVDGRTGRRDGFGRASRDRDWSVRVLGLLPDPESEAWFVAGFVPRSSAEEESLAAVTKRLRFDPTEMPQPADEHGRGRPEGREGGL